MRKDATILFRTVSNLSGKGADMFIRSKDGKHLTKAKSIDLEEKKILVNGVIFAEYESEEEAGMVFHDLCQECCNLETFFDLKGEISDDDEEWDDDDGDYVFITRPEE
jgi:hypothetical protein